jgi:hypothetical protein
VTELEAAIASVTRALGDASGEAVTLLASERAAMRAELQKLERPETSRPSSDARNERLGSSTPPPHVQAREGRKVCVADDLDDGLSVLLGQARQTLIQLSRWRHLILREGIAESLALGKVSRGLDGCVALRAVRDP